MRKQLFDDIFSALAGFDADIRLDQLKLMSVTIYVHRQ